MVDIPLDMALLALLQQLLEDTPQVPLTGEILARDSTCCLQLLLMAKSIGHYSWIMRPGLCTT